jgi:hypothetical protein
MTRVEKHVEDLGPFNSVFMNRSASGFSID